MSAVSGGGGNYVSDGSIMEWLALQQDRIYGDLKDSMDLAEKRAGFTDDLNNIKSAIHDANGKKDFTQVSADMKAFTEKYGAEPEFAELCEGLKGMFDDVCSGGQAMRDYQEKLAAYPAAKAAYEVQQLQFSLDPQLVLDAVSKGTVLAEPELPTKPTEQSYDDDKLKQWDELIAGKVDVASKNDQLTMIHIQELKATLDQGSQLASTFISSGDKTQSAIINNIA